MGGREGDDVAGLPERGEEALVLALLAEGEGAMPGGSGSHPQYSADHFLHCNPGRGAARPRAGLTLRAKQGAIANHRENTGFLDNKDREDRP